MTGTDTITVLGLDGADHQLLEHYDCQHILLDNHSQLETYSHARDYPLTREVWPTIATGHLPTDTAESRRGADWNGPLSAGNYLAKRLLPMRARSRLGIHLRSGPEVYQHAGDHVFQDGGVYNWPGITPAHNWNRNSYWLQQLHAGAIDTDRFWRCVAATGGMGIGWLAAMSHVGLPIVGVHVHQLDSAGHVWAGRPDALRERYRAVDRMVGMLRAAVDDLVILSDHGMQSSAVGDPDPGEHSFRAVIASTVPGELPGHVADVREWLDRLKPDGGASGERGSGIDTPTERLQDMGYLE